MAFSLVVVMGQSWQHEGGGTPVCWLPQLWFEHHIVRDAGHLLLDIALVGALVSTCMHFQIVAPEINA